jgi:hypothetical protein
MRTLTKTRITIATAVAIILAMNATTMIFDTAHAASSVSVTQSVTQRTQDGSNSVRVTQSTEDGLDVECEGNLKCEIIGDDTVIATSGDNTTTAATAVTTTLNQSNIVQLGNNDLDDVIEEQDIGTKIEGMVDRLLDEIFG